MARLAHGRPARLLLLAALFLIAGCANRRATRAPQPAEPGASASLPAQATAPLDPAKLAAGFNAAEASSYLTQLASPSMDGRHVGTQGELKGANYIAGLLAADGLQPAGDRGTYLQAFPMTVEEQASTPTLALSAPGSTTRNLRLRDDFRPLFGGLAGAGDASGPGLFVGADANLPSLNVSGKVLFALTRGSIKDLVTRARDAGAVAVIIPTGEQPILKSEGSAPDANSIPVALVSQSGATALLEGSGNTRDELNVAQRAGQSTPSFPLAWTISYHVSLRPPAHIDAHNVLGVLPGPSGSKTILVGAHYEEIGPDPDGVVYPAANDNASGVAVVLELAALLHRAGAHPPATIVFAAWSGHEEGLFGSKYYIDHPVRPLEQTLFYLNIDTVGQGTGSTVDAFPTGSGARSLAQKTVEALQADGGQPQAHLLDDAAGTSDDETFTKAGVSILALSWTGLFEGSKIHTPADSADTVDPAKLGVTGAFAAALLAEAAR